MQERVRSKKEHIVVLLSLQRGDSNEKIVVALLSGMMFLIGMVSNGSEVIAQEESVEISKTSPEDMIIDESLSYEEVEGYGDIVEQYIIIKGEQIYFDKERAEVNNEPNQVINQGVLLEAVSTDFTNNEFRRFGLPIRGNYCGPWHGGKDSSKPATDILDQGCKAHDQCYNWSLAIGDNCECNRALVNHIKANEDKMSGRMASVAWAIKQYFSSVGLVGC